MTLVDVGPGFVTLFVSAKSWQEGFSSSDSSEDAHNRIHSYPIIHPWVYLQSLWGSFTRLQQSGDSHLDILFWKKCFSLTDLKLKRDLLKAQISEPTNVEAFLLSLIAHMESGNKRELCSKSASSMPVLRWVCLAASQSRESVVLGDELRVNKG